ncbi:hypothetical protein PVL29_011506 [Vitis rotundifolia]|nr:hypothetical protein PVL29_011506 [Vitis rotundifolia]
MPVSVSAFSSLLMIVAVILSSVIVSATKRMSHFLEAQDLCIRCRPSVLLTAYFICKYCNHVSSGADQASCEKEVCLLRLLKCDLPSKDEKKGETNKSKNGKNCLIPIRGAGFSGLPMSRSTWLQRQYHPQLSHG